jgi:hypothetical protein
MIFKTHIYDRESIEGSSNYWGLFILALLLSVLGYLLNDILNGISMLLMLFSTGFLYYLLYRDWGKKEPEGKYVGELILSPDQFTIDKEVLLTSEINELRIEIGHPKGFKMWHRHGYTISSGTTSRMEWTIKGKKRHCNFQLYSNSQLKEIKQVLEQLYLKHIFVKEFHLGNRTYLLEELDYEEIQEFKKKYGLR